MSLENYSWIKVPCKFCNKNFEIVQMEWEAPYKYCICADCGLKEAKA